MGSIDLSSVRSCWGNSNFDYVHSDSVGNSGGILCIWDPNSFRRSSFTRSDYFVIVRGVWLKSGIDLMIVVVYAPQEAKEKRMLWDYLAHVSNQWVGKLVMMGDFNEVRYKSDRYGSNFNAHDAEIFNSFIYNAGLDEVPLGGSAYTWCLKSASKMSKLDRFFVSENLLSMCPNITAITLERFISDHRPILLREVRYDYGPIPFRFYRYWLEVDGFDKLVRDSWNVAPVNKKNAIRNFMGKLKFLKDRIRSWLSIHRSNSRGEIYFLKEELRSCDEVIDKGDCSNEVVHKRKASKGIICGEGWSTGYHYHTEAGPDQSLCMDYYGPTGEWDVASMTRVQVQPQEDMEAGISKGRQTPLLKSPLFTVRIYAKIFHMSIFKVPSSYSKSLGILYRGFKAVCPNRRSHAQVGHWLVLFSKMFLMDKVIKIITIRLKLGTWGGTRGSGSTIRYEGPVSFQELFPKYLLGGISDIVGQGCEFLRRNGKFALFLLGFNPKLKGVLTGVYLVCGGICGTFRKKALCKASFKWDDWLKNPYIVLV
ncbi:RNA-directed DNA polymerase, eukaryota [Tanacetum coccineum]